MFGFNLLKRNRHPQATQHRHQPASGEYPYIRVSEPAAIRVLIVEDDELVRDTFALILEEAGYHVDCTCGAKEALAMLKHTTFDIMLCDIFMPEQNGMELLPLVRHEYPEMPVVLITGYGTAEMARSALAQGAIDFVTKPLKPGDLPIIIGNSLVRQAAMRKTTQKRWQALMTSNETVLDVLMTALNVRDVEPQGHCQRVTEMTLYLAEAFQLPERELIEIRRGALLHDIGKIGIPDSILLKPDKLTSEEWIEMRKHPVIGYEMCVQSDLLKAAAIIVLHHHEAWDGSGYPDGLKGEAIPFGARLFAIADTLDAMTSSRPYRCALSFADAQQEIKRCSGRQFDPQIVKTFLSIPQRQWQPLLTKAM